MQNRPKSTSPALRIHPKPDQKDSGSPPCDTSLDRLKTGVFVRFPTEAGNEREVTQRLHSSSSRRRKMSASLSLLGRRGDLWDRESLGLQGGRCWSRSANGIPLGGPKARLTPNPVGTEVPSKCGQCVDANAKTRTKCKTRNQKMMAPPLRFLVLPAFLSLGNRCNGLPHRYDPLSRFLTFSAVFSRPNLATLFHVASAQRIPGLQSFSHSASSDTSRCPMLFCRFLLLRFGKVTLSVPLPQRSTVRRQAFYHRSNKTTSNWRGSSTLELCSN